MLMAPYRKPGGKKETWLVSETINKHTPLKFFSRFPIKKRERHSVGSMKRDLPKPQQAGYGKARGYR